MAPTHLSHYLEASAGHDPDRTAVVEPTGGAISYGDLNRQADAVARFLMARGVNRGDRVGVVLPKSIVSVVSLFGITKAGAAYVPVDYHAPAERGKRILTDCRVRALIVDSRCLGVVPDDPAAEDSDGRCVVVAVGVTDMPGVIPFDTVLATGGPPVTGSGPITDLAYVLYTSGSTGTPKGVMLTHENALSFVEWCSSVFQPTDTDRFSSHAPFHFDLSVLDLYLSVKHGATLYLIPDDLGKSPKNLARLIAEHRLTVWYSTPSILTLLLQFGSLDAHDVSSLRLVLFAGEVFPIKHLRALKRHWPSPVYYNLYGPTETNVCTFARIPDVIPDDRDTPYPIGFACAHCAPLVLGADGCEVNPGDEGLLHVAGPSVFAGYWNRPAENDAAFVERDGVRWYNTGDLVRWDPNEGFLYAGRKDRMVKRRGYRIELGEIERALYAHAAVREAAVVAVPDADAGVKIVAFLSCHEGEPPSVIEMKTFCGTKVPAYMSPDRFVFQTRLPKTSTDKVDYQGLRALLAESSAS